MTDERSTPRKNPETSRTFDALLNGFVRPETAEERPTAALSGKRDVYIRFLRKQGYQFAEDSDGDLRFRREGVEFILFVDEDDDQYFRISLPWAFSPGSEDDWLRTLRVANQMNLKFKTVKAVLGESSLWLYVEAFFVPFEVFGNVFERCLDTLAIARREIVDTLGD